jgi:hypothetical protein
MLFSVQEQRGLANIVNVISYDDITFKTSTVGSFQVSKGSLHLQENAAVIDDISGVGYFGVQQIVGSNDNGLIFSMNITSGKVIAVGTFDMWFKMLAIDYELKCIVGLSMSTDGGRLLAYRIDRNTLQGKPLSASISLSGGDLILLNNEEVYDVTNHIAYVGIFYRTSGTVYLFGIDVEKNSPVPSVQMDWSTWLTDDFVFDVTSNQIIALAKSNSVMGNYLVGIDPKTGISTQITPQSWNTYGYTSYAATICNPRRL